MRKPTITIFAFNLAAFIVCPGAEIHASEDQCTLVECVRVLAIPPFGRFAYVGNLDGKPIDVTVSVGNNGGISRVEFPRDAERLQRREIEEYLRRSTFKTSCAGKQVKIRYTFKVEGSAEEYRHTRTEFVPPNQFVIYTTPLKTSTDRW